MSSFKDLFEKAKQGDSYWSEKLILEFVVQLTRALEQNNISKTQFAERLNTSQAYITKVLRGNANFTIHSMVKLARAAECDVDISVLPKENNVTWCKLVEGGGKRTPVRKANWARKYFPSYDTDEHDFTGERDGFATGA